jgi:hypothetical protein
MSKKNTKTEAYRVTPKGLIGLATMDNKDIWDDLELFCYRHGYNAILVNRDGGEFINVEMDGGTK